MGVIPVKLHELAGNTSACTTRREVKYDFMIGEKTFIHRSNIGKQVLRDIADGKMTEADVPETLKEAFTDLGFKSNRQMELQAEEMTKQILRYVNSETRKSYSAKGLDVDLGHDVIATHIHPDAVFYDKDEDGLREIEVVRFKFRRPDIHERDKYQSLELYALMKYARLLVNPGETVTLKASVYFMRKQNDSAAKAVFDEDFFDKQGKNVITIEERFTKPGTDLKETDSSFTGIDKVFEPFVKRFAEGIPEAECSESDCDKCDYKPICKWTDPPMSIPVKKKVRAAMSVRLSPEQREAKEYENGIVRINAGAGAGKTLVVALRVVSLLNKGVKPEHILLITFTNAGAQEMRDRIKSLAEDDGIADEVDISKILIMTFNAFGDLIIRENYKLFGFSEEPHLIDDVERFKIVCVMIKDKLLDLDYRNFTMDEGRVKGAVATAAHAFAIFKNNPSLGLGDIDTLYEKMDRWKAFCPKNTFIELYRLYGEYDEILRNESLIEFSDQQNLIFELLGMQPYYFEKYGIEHIIVDEFQDTSEEQIRIIKQLSSCPSFKSLMMVGDDSQGVTRS